MYLTISLIIVFLIIPAYVLSLPQFGKSPSGERLERIKKSPNYRDGAFQNQSYTPVFADDGNFIKVFSGFLKGRVKRLNPAGEIPSTKTDLLNLDKNADALVWFGHSSYFMQVDGKKFLVDPVFSGAASPFSFAIKAFKGTDRYTADDMPEIDYLIITHDHWDHLDYETVVKLIPKVKRVICGLGTGSYLEYWGYDKNIITEMDWDEQISTDDNIKITSVPSRHFSGRTLKRNQTLWTSFVLQTPAITIFMGCDGGYDKHFAEIGKKFGPIDFAILENGQNDSRWKYIHMMPDEFSKTFSDLKAKRYLSIHSSKFALANHAWDEPMIRISESARESNVTLITPMIGEFVDLKDGSQKFMEWWKGVE
jgi:L-ascorbate metabolism protein UlaG (beta-lactamase superfamily)